MSEEKQSKDYALFIAKKCRFRLKAHDQSRVIIYKRLHYLTLCIIVLNAVITAVSQLPLEGIWFKYTLGVLSLLATTFVAILKFLGYEKLQGDHQSAARDYLNLRDFIHIHMIGQKPADFLTTLSTKYEHIRNMAPLLLVQVEDMPEESLRIDEDELAPLKLEMDK